jgi:hypothetical protein
MSLEWQPSESSIDFGNRVMRELMRLGWWQGDNNFWATAIGNLQRTIAVAMASRRRDSGAWVLGGSVIELVGSEWAITEAGLEAPRHGFIVGQRSFPNPIEQLARNIQGAKVKEWKPPSKPDWADSEEWAYLISRGKSLFPRRDIAALMIPQRWFPVGSIGD